jgi:hypothetical protein
MAEYSDYWIDVGRAVNSAPSAAEPQRHDRCAHPAEHLSLAAWSALPDHERAAAELAAYGFSIPETSATAPRRLAPPVKAVPQRRNHKHPKGEPWSCLACGAVLASYTASYRARQRGGCRFCRPTTDRRRTIRHKEKLP